MTYCPTPVSPFLIKDAYIEYEIENCIWTASSGAEHHTNYPWAKIFSVSGTVASVRKINTPEGATTWWNVGTQINDLGALWVTPGEIALMGALYMPGYKFY
ncbi:MAG: hypothetical protein FWD26_09800 [Treponema sp.]|nr:hypothetical protein [Treponema sp.]